MEGSKTKLLISIAASAFLVGPALADEVEALMRQFAGVCLGIAIVAEILSMSAANASVVAYTSIADFEAAAPDAATYDFSGIPIATPPYSNDPVAIGPGTFGGNGYSYFGGFVLGPPATNTYGVPFLTEVGVSNSIELVYYTENFISSAVGFDIGYSNNNLGPMTLEVCSAGNCYFEQAIQPLTTLFVGFVSSTPISNWGFAILLNGSYGDVQGQLTGLDVLDVSIEGTATPLPPTWTLMTGGLGAMGLLGWRRKKKIAARAA